MEQRSIIGRLASRRRHIQFSWWRDFTSGNSVLRKQRVLTVLLRRRFSLSLSLSVATVKLENSADKLAPHARAKRRLSPRYHLDIKYGLFWIICIRKTNRRRGGPSERDKSLPKSTKNFSFPPRFWQLSNCLARRIRHSQRTALYQLSDTTPLLNTRLNHSPSSRESSAPRSVSCPFQIGNLSVQVYHFTHLP